MRIFIFFVLVTNFLFGGEKLLITKFNNLAPFYYKNQIVKLNLDIITAKNGTLIVEDENNNTYPITQKDENYIGHISFLLKDKFPTIYVKLKDGNKTIDETNLTINSQIRQLHPPKHFCGVLADGIKISDKVLSNYDNKSNIVYWTIEAKNGNLKDFKLGLANEKLYFLDKNDTFSSYSYSAIVPISQTNFSFNYFNLKSGNYQTLSFSIPLKNETISTQTDITPMAKSNLYIINGVVGVVILLWGIIYYYRRKIIYIILIIMGIGVLVFLNLPKKEIILKEGTRIQILPFKNSTTFLVTSIDTKVKVLKERNGYKKIEFNKYIGWVKDE